MIVLPGRHPRDREILRLAVPALGALAAEPLYLLADTAVVGHLGTEALAGLAVASAVLLTTSSLAIFLAYGTTASVARLLGAGEHRRAAHEAVQSLWLAFAIGLMAVGVGLAAGPTLLQLLGAEGAVLAQATTYLLVSLPGLPAMLMVLAGTGYLRGLQDTRTPLWVALGSSTANLVIELVLIFGLGYAIGASALATLIAQWGAAAVYLHRIGSDVARRGVGLRPDPTTLRSLVGVAGALVVRTAALRAALVLATAVAARIGTVQLAAHQIAFELWNVLALSLDAVAIAAQALVGRSLGAGDAGAARADARRMLEWGLGAGVVFGAGVLALRGVLPEVFTDDPAVTATATGLLVAVAVLQPVNGLVFCLDGILIGASDMAFLARAMLGALAVFAPAALAVGWSGAGIGWLWAAIGALMMARLLALGLRFRGPAWLVVGADVGRSGPGNRG